MSLSNYLYNLSPEERKADISVVLRKWLYMWLYKLQVSQFQNSSPVAQIPLYTQVHRWYLITQLCVELGYEELMQDFLWVIKSLSNSEALQYS